jgi:hypothetical protein
MTSGGHKLGPFLSASLLLFVLVSNGLSNPNVYVSRFWHNHQPLYWPEWNGNGSQTNRGQYAWDSITLKPNQNYGGISPSRHPENDLVEIFGKDDRRKGRATLAQRGRGQGLAPKSKENKGL